jgi:hypothetical protein
MLNIFYIIIKYVRQQVQYVEIINFFLDYLLPASIRFPKHILFATKIVNDIIGNFRYLD